ncbi:hydrolase [Floricoccus penangensis]|uniref:Hydrolase n=1 Tax=Floricoccus penangensis TaxID=1859475 RepID=A0A9Q5JGF1_9LACT|nr:Cof-type HAD-IIB family hydrolase [Floricoccus penangensis]OFI46873.1 hydrolase [Floricoccus penangensis]
MYKLIAFDMDGTLLTSQKIIAESSIKAIKKASSVGKNIVLSTGRALVELDEYMPILPDVKYGVLASGALVYDFKNKKILHQHKIPASVVDQIGAIVEEKKTMVVAMIDGKIYVQRSHYDHIENYHMDYYKDLYTHAATFVDDICQILKEERGNFEKINLYHFNDKDRLDTYEELRKENITIVKAEETGVEITDKGVEKGEGLEFLCDYLDIPISQAIAVGDADNDESMIKIAGLGVAMGNANENIKSLADVIVNDNDHGGCAQVIDEYLLVD